jgi:hypothetical protein
VRTTAPPASGGARLTAAGPDGFDVVTPRATLVRQRYTPYYRATGGCVSRGPEGWTRVTPDGTGRAVRVGARFDLEDLAVGDCEAVRASSR